MERFIFALLLLFFVFVSPSYASNFTTDYNVSYSVLESSKTRVNLDITLTNTTAEYYASSYNIRVGFKNIENVKASDPDGIIVPKITKDANGENIELNFNKRVVGLGNKLNFNLFFDTSEVAEKNGSVWEVNIPGLSNQSEFSSFNVTVSYPSFLGRPSFIKPDISNAISKSNGNSLSFSKGDLGSGGISIAFGRYQIYSFDLTYHLENKNLFPVSTEIALPPETSYQEISLESLVPAPQNVYLDSDGNWLAKYSLSPSQNTEVKARGRVKVYLNPKKEIVSKEKLSQYTAPQRYWETQSSKIKSLASDLKTPRGIYDYIVNNLTYDFSRVTLQKPRAGALNVLDNPNSAVCLEFTDLFVGLSRAAGIPARDINGFAYTKNPQERPLSLVKDVLHAWPQYYDTNLESWVMVDPTWGNTTNGIDYFNTFDFDHFAFVIKGKDSSYPIPAGGYKRQQDIPAKDVVVELADDFISLPTLKIQLFLPKESLPWIPISGFARITNLGTGISQKGELSINTNFLSAKQKNITVDKIPPQGFIDIPISFASSPFLTKKSDLITIQFEKNSYQKSILISPFAGNTVIFGGIIFVTTIVLSVFAIRSRRIFFQRQ